ncbi:MAG TPA: hypothetical protein VMR59_02005 [Patescibacteria group bacterium]|jgi:hypothetical protein|nr:hypothetical protein [Patescibacteria group bacterium]
MTKIENKKQFIPSKPVVILAIIILIIAFLGAFAFSFIKSPPSSLLSQPTLNQSNPGGLPSAGGVGNLPSGSIVKTKEEGIAVCKKSGVDYCWSAVAVSFNDLSVCKMAQDVKQCESDAKDLMQLHSQSQ